MYIKYEYDKRVWYEYEYQVPFQLDISIKTKPIWLEQNGWIYEGIHILCKANHNHALHTYWLHTNTTYDKGKP